MNEPSTDVLWSSLILKLPSTFAIVVPHPTVELPLHLPRQATDEHLTQRPERAPPAIANIPQQKVERPRGERDSTLLGSLTGPRLRTDPLIHRWVLRCSGYPYSLRESKTFKVGFLWPQALFCPSHCFILIAFDLQPPSRRANQCSRCKPFVPRIAARRCKPFVPMVPYVRQGKNRFFFAHVTWREELFFERIWQSCFAPNELASHELSNTSIRQDEPTCHQVKSSFRLIKMRN